MMCVEKQHQGKAAGRWSTTFPAVPAQGLDPPISLVLWVA